MGGIKDIKKLFENENVIVLFKPSGLIVHNDGKRNEKNVVDWILKNFPSLRGVGEDMKVKGKDGEDVSIERPGIVHRIDRDTSGVLVLAKNQDSFLDLKEKFKKREIKKTYIALVYGCPREKEGVIDVPIGRSKKDFRMRQAGFFARGKMRDALTHYRVINCFEDQRKKNKQGKYDRYALLELTPKTGRTHQIRVHLKYINHPIVADPLYRGKRKECLGLKRTALHARSISFVDKDREEISVRAEIPEDFQRAVSLLKPIDF